MIDSGGEAIRYFGPDVKPYASHTADVLLMIRETIGWMLLADLSEIEFDHAPKDYRLTIKARRSCR